jgi:vanillate O-demethylase ferredoxin subunit
VAEQAIEVRIAQRVIEADGIISLELVALDGSALPPFEAGSHVDLHVAPGLIRQYSLSNDPSETHRYRLGILLDALSRGGSASIHKNVASGQTIRISIPRNHFPLVETARHSVLIGGGIGITPLIAMAYRLERLGASFELHYCVRTRPRAAFLSELSEPRFAGKVSLHVDDEAAEQRLNPDQILAHPSADTHLYVCGPDGLMSFITDAATQRGWQSTQIHLERFSATIEVGGDSLVVTAARSGKRFVIPAEKTIAEILMAGGIDVPLSCEQGVCGTCITTVLSGIPDHRDLYLTDQERAANNQMTICCSRAKTTELVLDI